MCRTHSLNEEFRGWVEYELQSPRLIFCANNLKPNSILAKNLTWFWLKTWLDRLSGAIGEKFSPKGYSHQTISRVSRNVLKCATLCLEVTIFSIFCRTPVDVPLCFETNICWKNLNFPLIPSKWYTRLFIYANIKYLYERFKRFIWDGTHCISIYIYIYL